MGPSIECRPNQTGRQAPERHAQHGERAEPHTGPKPLLPSNAMKRGSKSYPNFRPAGNSSGRRTKALREPNQQVRVTLGNSWPHEFFVC